MEGKPSSLPVSYYPAFHMEFEVIKRLMPARCLTMLAPRGNTQPLLGHSYHFLSLWFIIIIMGNCASFIVVH